MNITNWQQVVEEKIADSKERGSKKRGWVKFTKTWLTSSINYRMELNEQAVFSKLIIMADEYGPVPGLISDNDFRAMPHDYIAHLACCPIEILEITLKKSISDDSIFENGSGIFLTHFDDYQFTEYDRQKGWRKEKREQEKESKSAYGEFENVLLSDIEKAKLIEKFGESGFSDRVEKLSCGIESKGYIYINHYATILSWQRMDDKREVAKSETHQRAIGKLPTKYTRPEELLH